MASVDEVLVPPCSLEPTAQPTPIMPAVSGSASWEASEITDVLRKLVLPLLSLDELKAMVCTCAAFRSLVLPATWRAKALILLPSTHGVFHSAPVVFKAALFRYGEAQKSIRRGQPFSIFNFVPSSLQPDSPAHLSFAPDAEHLALISPQQVSLWQLKDGEICRLHSLQERQPEAWRILGYDEAAKHTHAWSSDSKLFTTYGPETEIVVVDVSDHPFKTTSQAVGELPSMLAWAPHQPKLAVQTVGQKLFILDHAAGSLAALDLDLDPHDKALRLSWISSDMLVLISFHSCVLVCFTGDGSYVTAIDSYSDLATHSVSGRIDHRLGLAMGLWCVASVFWCPDTAILSVCINLSGSFEPYQVQQYELKLTPSTIQHTHIKAFSLPSSTTSVAFSPKGTSIAAGGPVKLRLVSAADGAVIWTYESLFAQSPPCLHWNPDGRLLLVTNRAGVVMVLDGSSGSNIYQHCVTSERPVQAIWAASGAQITVWGSPNHARVLNFQAP